MAYVIPYNQYTKYYHLADVISAQDYYPFGSTVPGRKYTAPDSEYRFGFQGQEKNNDLTDVEGGHLDFKYRVHDARLGRFLSVDPLTMSFPWNSPYAFSENRVIDSRELEGLERIHFTYSFDYVVEYPSETQPWRQYIPFADYPKKTLTEGVVTAVQVEDSRDLTFNVKIMIPIISPHNTKNPRYKEYTYSGSPEGFSNPENWTESTDVIDAFNDGFQTGVYVGLADPLMEKVFAAMGGVMLKHWRASRFAKMGKWIDEATGRAFRNHEISGAIDFEIQYKTLLAPVKGGKGDFFGLTGKYSGKVFDHMGTTLEGASQKNFMKQFTKSIDKHMPKLSDGVDYIMMDLKNMTKEQAKSVKNYVKTNYSKQSSKVLYTN